jgi:hypothetical protein
MEPVPPKLDYQMPQSAWARHRPQWGLFSLGLFGGLAISLVYYMSLGTDVARHTPAAPFGAVLFKLVAGITMICFPRWRSVGVGLVVSVPLAILIFLGLCFGVVAFNR